MLSVRFANIVTVRLLFFFLKKYHSRGNFYKDFFFALSLPIVFYIDDESNHARSWRLLI